MSGTLSKKEENAYYFKSHLPEFLKNEIYKYKFLVIQSQSVKGVFDTFSAALEYAAANFPPSEFIIQQVIGEDEQINFVLSAVS